MGEKASTPPPTEVLSKTREDLSSTPPNEELAGTPPSEVPPAPGQTQEQLPETEAPFTVDETGEQVPAGTEEEPTGDPLKDTQAALTRQSQEVANLKKVLAGIVAQQGITGKPSAETPGPPAEFLSLDPTEDERADPILYAQRMEKRREYLETVNSMQDFIDHNPDWQDLYPTMEQIRNEEPDGFKGPRALRQLHKRAKERQELIGYREALAKTGETAFKAGANMERGKGNRPFVSPTGGRKASGTATPPPDFPNWDTDKQLQWLKAHGFYKENMY